MRQGDVGDDADRLPQPRSAQEQPVDLEAVRADDDLIEALAAGLVRPPTRRPGPGDVDEQLVALLSSWVADVRPESLLHRPADTWATSDGPAEVGSRINGRASVDPPGAPLGVDLGRDLGLDDEVPADTVVMPVAVAAEPDEQRPLLFTIGDTDGGTIGDTDGATDDTAAETRPIPHVTPLHGRRSMRPLQRFAAAAAFIALAGSGLVIGAWDAKPGTALWPVTSVVFAEKASSVQAAVDVVSNLTRARAAFGAHHVAEAQSAYQDAVDRLSAVAPAEGHAALVQETSVIAQQFGFPAPTATQTDVVNSDSRNVLAAGSAGATTGNSSAPASATDTVLAAGGKAPGSAADTNPFAGVPVPGPPAVAAPASGKPGAGHPGSIPDPPDVTPTTAPPVTSTDVDPPSSTDPISADPTSAVAPSTDPVSADPTSASPPSTDPTSALPSSTDPESTDPGNTDPSHSDPSGTQTTGDETIGDGTTGTGGDTAAASVVDG